MFKWLCIAATLVAATLFVSSYSDPAFAVVQSADVSVTPPPGATKAATLSLPSGKTVPLSSKPKRVPIDPNKKYTVNVPTQDGKTTRKVSVDGAALLDGKSADLGDGWTIQGTPSSAAVPNETPRPVSVRVRPTVIPLDNAMPMGGPGSFYVSVSVDGVNNSTGFRPTQYGSAGTGDRNLDTRESGSKTSAAPNVAVGMFMPNFGGLQTAVEVEFSYLDSEVNIQGLPGLVGFPTAVNDSLSIKKEWMLTIAGIMYLPEPYRSWYLKAGLALVKERFEYNCTTAGFCGVGPATAPFSASDSQIALGALIGIGYEKEITQWRMGDRRYFARFGYDHIFVPSYDVSAGTIPTRFVGGRVDNDIDRIYLQLAMSVSDVRLKRDIVRVGALESGIPLYRYKYLNSDTDFVGVMAQEVALLKPAAVVHGEDGYLRVNYAMLGTKLMTWKDWQATR